MTREEFLLKLPGNLIHKDVGQSRLVILMDQSENKVASYVSGEYQIPSIVRSASSWESLYKEMIRYLKDEGHLK